MRKPLRYFAAIVALVTSAGAGMQAADAQQLSSEALRAAQIGVVQNFNRLPPAEDLRTAIDSVRRRAPTSPGPGLSGIRMEHKMVGGVTVPANSFRELARISFLTTGDQEDLCTGWFIDSNSHTRVLTAGHCTCGRPSSYTIVRGDHETEATESFVLAAPPVRYSGYSCLLQPESQNGRDLAILWVKPKDAENEIGGDQPGFETLFLDIATMHQIYRDTDTKRLVGVGFGRTERGVLPRNAVAAMIPIGSAFCGGGSFAASSCASFREFVLADPVAGAGANPPDSCGGDSGGPIFWVPPATAPGAATTSATITSPERVLVGVTSRALDGVRHNSGTTCGGGGIYTALGHPDVIRWLQINGISPRMKMQ